MSQVKRRHPLIGALLVVLTWLAVNGIIFLPLYLAFGTRALKLFVGVSIARALHRSVIAWLALTSKPVLYILSVTNLVIFTSIGLTIDEFRTHGPTLYGAFVIVVFGWLTYRAVESAVFSMANAPATFVPNDRSPRPKQTVADREQELMDLHDRLHAQLDEVVYNGQHLPLSVQNEEMGRLVRRMSQVEAEIKRLEDTEATGV
jgi:hypothetical protein